MNRAETQNTSILGREEEVTSASGLNHFLSFSPKLFTSNLAQFLSDPLLNIQTQVMMEDVDDVELQTDLKHLTRVSSWLTCWQKIHRKRFAQDEI